MIEQPTEGASRPGLDITIAGDAAYDGPLDLLLALVRREGYPMDRLPVAAITRQYLDWLRRNANRNPDRSLKKVEIDVDQGAEFFETASWLVLLKSRALLPLSAGEETPEQELARTLLSHQALRAAASQLRERLDGAGLGPGMHRAEDPGDGSEGAKESQHAIPRGREEAAAPTVHDVLLAARRALEQARAHAQGSAVAAPDPYPLENLYRELEERLAALEPGRGVSTEEWFRELPDPQARCALLLALLELARLGRVLLGQREPLGPVLLICSS